MPRQTKVPGHTPLAPSPLLRRKPQQRDRVSMSADDLAMSAETPARTISPTTALSPNSRMNHMLRQSTVTTGGTGGGAIAAITTLKSDLVLVQAEIDGMTKNGSGALELQGTLTRFGPAADERTNFETCNTLMSLLLLKLNELARYCSGPNVMSTAPRQSRVGDLLAFFRHTGSGGAAGHAAQSQLNSPLFRNRADSGTHLPDANASVTYAGSIIPGMPLTMTRGDEALSHGHIGSGSGSAPNPDIETRGVHVHATFVDNEATGSGGSPHNTHITHTQRSGSQPNYSGASTRRRERDGDESTTTCRRRTALLCTHQTAAPAAAVARRVPAPRGSPRRCRFCPLYRQRRKGSASRPRSVFALWSDSWHCTGTLSPRCTLSTCSTPRCVTAR
jgi:hypothetical protein